MELHFNPEEDGKTHINTYSRGRTKLGRSLSNFARYPFIHPEDGYFESVEGYWYYISTNRQFDDLRIVSNYDAKKLGQQLSKKHGRRYFDEKDKNDVLEAIRCKLRQNKDLLKEFTYSTLPFVHYYVYGDKNNYKIQTFPEYQYVMDEMERIRGLCKKRWNIV